MTRKDIIRMAQEAEFPAANYPTLVSDKDWEALERFFKAAYAAGAAAEREACADLCEDTTQEYEEYTGRPLPLNFACAAAIRARGQA